MKPASPSAPESFATRFGEPEIIPADIYSRPISVNISPDGQATTASFQDGITAELLPNEKDSATTVAVLRIPVTLPEPLNETFLGYYVRLDGLIDKTEGTRASVLVELAGVTKTVEFQYGKALQENFDEHIFAFSNKHPLLPSHHLTAVIVLTIQRIGPQDSGFVTIDSCSVEINKLQRIPKDEE
jgi:hypothetical protein